ncbi:MAG: hypothetical protein M8858_01900, partial [marine benthic group bacterium]|nr:hypothetical protein [Gemmatimonadota bacterium]
RRSKGNSNSVWRTMDNLGFIVAGYTLTWVTLVWYAWRTNRRLDAAANALEEWTETSAGTGRTAGDTGA